MAYLVENRNGEELIFQGIPHLHCSWFTDDIFNEGVGSRILLPKGTIKKLIGHDLTLKDIPVKLK